MGRANGVVCRADPERNVSIFSTGPFHFVNGLSLDAEECCLYIVGSNLDRVARVEVKPDGNAGPREVFSVGPL